MAILGGLTLGLLSLVLALPLEQLVHLRCRLAPVLLRELGSFLFLGLTSSAEEIFLLLRLGRLETGANL